MFYIRCGGDDDLTIEFSAVALKTRMRHVQSDDQEHCFKFENKVIHCYIFWNDKLNCVISSYYWEYFKCKYYLENIGWINEFIIHMNRWKYVQRSVI